MKKYTPVNPLPVAQYVVEQLPHEPYYLLEGRTIRLATMMESAMQLERAEERIVGKTTLGNNVEVSTVFLGINHDHWGTGKPVLFETMIFGGEHDEYQTRYCTYDEAEAGHNRIVENLLAGKHPDDRD